ncbi:uncharacterized protein LOC119603429 [Lucilia sericata]|uniref:uncharacterized protein LOC119603429 n=1 Tax=Lucilia sericata TaxID=13632 RepID=UPI0018A87467|nr:uncharacterized protein LOC119603429 [Lucilia sericata]
MRLKSLHTTATNQRLRPLYAGNMFVLSLFLCCLLSSEVWSFANIKQRHRLVRQLNAAEAVNYDKDSSMTNLYHQPHFTENRAVIVQLFEWKFLDIAEECRNFLGPQGYAGVQISPVLEHTVIETSTVKHPWWERYEVISYRLASRSGDESDFWSMSRICNEHGVRIYVDVVLNHMAAPLNFLFDIKEQDNKDFIVNTLLETNVNISQLNYSNVSYTQVDFHRTLCAVLSHTQDAHEIRNCQLNGHPDLDHSRAGVQKHIVELLNKFIDMGVAGFRIDTAKYMWPIDLKNILKQVKNLSTEFKFKKNSRPFVYHDVFDLGLDTVSKTEYSTYGVVSEYLYPAELATIIQRKVPLSSLINWGPALGFLAHEDALVFIDSHDTQRGLPQQLGNNQLLTYKQRPKYIMANVFMLIHPYGAIKRIMSSYYFADKDINQGPPTEDEEGEQISSPQFNEQQQCTKESGWVCEHRWPVLVNMLKVANYFSVPGQEEPSIIYFQTNGANQVAFCRGYKAFVAINNEPEIEFEKEVYACLEPGTYCDMVTGGKKEGEEKCHGKMVVINEQGYTKLKLAVADVESGDNKEENVEGEEESGRIESYGILVIYVESKILPNEAVDASNEGEEINDTEESEAEVKEVGEDEPLEENIEQPNEDEENNTGAEQPEEADVSSKEESETGENQGEENAEEDAKEEEEVAAEEEAGAADENTEGETADPETAKEDGEADENQPEENEEEEDVNEEGAEGTADDNTEGEADDGDTSKEEDETDENNPEDEEEDAKAGVPDEEEAGDDADNTEGEADDPESPKEEGEAEENHPEEIVDDAEAEVPDAEEAVSENTDQEDGENDEDKGQEELEETKAELSIEPEEEVEEKASDDNDGDEENNSNNEEGGEESPKSEEEDVVEDPAQEEEGDVDTEADNKPEEEIPPNDQPPEEQDEAEDTEKDNSLEIITNEASIEQQDELETAESRNLDDKTAEAEEQMEKPITEIVDENSDASDAVTAKIQEVQAAGIFVKPKGDGNNG